MAGVVSIGEGHGGRKSQQEVAEVRREGRLRGGYTASLFKRWAGRKAGESRSGSAEGPGEMRPDSQRQLQDGALLWVHSVGRFIGLAVHISGAIHGLTFRRLEPQMEGVPSLQA